MVPNYKKFAAEKIHDRGPTSLWAKTGLKKAARIDRLFKSKYSLLPAEIQQFITAHNIPHADVLALLTVHYKNDALRLHLEVVVDTSKQVYFATADGPVRSTHGASLRRNATRCSTGNTYSCRATSAICLFYRDGPSATHGSFAKR